MQILGNIFNAIIFVSAIGGMFCVLSLFINHILRCTPPLFGFRFAGNPLCVNKWEEENMEQSKASGHLSALLTIIIWGTTFISTKVLLCGFSAH